MKYKDLLEVAGKQVLMDNGMYAVYSVNGDTETLIGYIHEPITISEPDEEIEVLTQEQYDSI